MGVARSFFTLQPQIAMARIRRLGGKRKSSDADDMQQYAKEATATKATLAAARAAAAVAMEEAGKGDKAGAGGAGPEARGGRSRGTPSSPARSYSEADWVPTLLGSSSDPPSLLTVDQLRKVSQALPARLAIKDWVLVYSTDQHGYSLRTFLARAERASSTLLLVLDSGGAVFGGFVSQPWRKGHHYFGTGESFLLQVHPRFAVYRWTSANDFFAIAEPNYLALGGGGGYGLHLDSCLEQGSSAKCDTFNNECLASAPEFRCVKLELWTFR